MQASPIGVQNTSGASGVQGTSGQASSGLATSGKASASNNQAGTGRGGPSPFERPDGVGTQLNVKDSK